MSGQVHLGHDGDAPRGGVVHHLPDFLPGIEAAVADVVVGGEVPPDHRAFAPAGDLAEEREGADLDAPALVVGQVPVETVELVHRHHVQVALDLVDAPEMPRGVQVHAAPGEARAVLDQAAGQRPAVLQGLPTAVYGRREQLPEGLQGVDDAVQAARADDGVPLRYEDGVGFRGEGSVAQEDDAFHLAAREGVAQAGRSGDRGGLAAGIAQARRETADRLHGRRIESRVAFDRGAADAERPFGRFGFRRPGDDVVQRTGARTQGQETKQQGGQ